MAIVLIVKIQDKDAETVKQIIDNSLFFSGWEPTMQATKGKYLLITNKSVVNNAQKEGDSLFRKFYETLLNNDSSETPVRMNKPLLHNQFSNYAAALSKKTSVLPLTT